MAQRVKDLVLSLRWLRSLLGHGFERPHAVGIAKKKKKNENWEKVGLAI